MWRGYNFGLGFSDSSKHFIHLQLKFLAIWRLKIFRAIVVVSCVEINRRSGDTNSKMDQEKILPKNHARLCGLSYRCPTSLSARYPADHPPHHYFHHSFYVLSNAGRHLEGCDHKLLSHMLAIFQHKIKFPTENNPNAEKVKSLAHKNCG